MSSYPDATPRIEELEARAQQQRDALRLDSFKAEKAVSWLHGFAYGASTAAALAGVVYLAGVA